MRIKLQKGLFIGDFPLSQKFGGNKQMYAKFGLLGHNGLDYAVPTGTVLISCINGTVIENEYDAGGYGNYIKIENDYCGVIYAHLKRKSDYQPGMKVVAGAEIGLSGNTGNSTGAHLHFGVFPKPRDRGNGYAGYIDPFNEELVEWVSSLDTGNAKIEKLENKVKELEKSIENWKTEFDKVHLENVVNKGILKDVAFYFDIENFDAKKDEETLRQRVKRDKAVMELFKVPVIDFRFRNQHIFVFRTDESEVLK